MLRADMSPKPVYEQVNRLIHQEWKTRLDATTDSDGRLGFRGFRGDYRLALEWQGHRLERHFHVAKDASNEIVITLTP